MHHSHLSDVNLAQGALCSNFRQMARQSAGNSSQSFPSLCSQDQFSGSIWLWAISLQQFRIQCSFAHDCAKDRFGAPGRAHFTLVGLGMELGMGFGMGFSMEFNIGFNMGFSMGFRMGFGTASGMGLERFWLTLHKQ